MSKYYVTVILAFLLLSIGRAQQSASPALKLDFFPAIPAVIDGCSESYTYDTVSLKKEKYIVITNMQGLAIIRVNGKEISLKSMSATQPAKKTHRDLYQGSGYTVIIFVKEIRQTGDEVVYLRGSVEIRYGTESKIYKIHGEGGC